MPSAIRFWTRVMAIALSTTLVGSVPSHAAAQGVTIREEGGQVHVSWPISSEETGTAVFNLAANTPLIDSLAIGAVGAPPRVISSRLNPVTMLTVGSRDLKPSGWTAFFDNPPLRPSET